MGPGRQHSRRPIHETRASGREAGRPVVRTTRIPALRFSVLGAMANWTAYDYDSYLANRARDNNVASTMTLRQYYKKPPWRRALCHILPMGLALCVGALAIMAIDRDDPVAISWGKIVPPEVVAGQPITFHYGSIRHHDYGGTIKRWIVDVHGQVFNLSETGVSGDKLPMNVEGEVVKDFVVPCGIAVGAAEYHADSALYSKWNFVQRLFPVHREIKYPFIVLNGAFDDACPGRTAQEAVPLPQARVINKVWIEPTTLHPGGQFVVHVNATINQLCPGETHWSLIRKADGVEVLKVIQPTTPTKIGENSFEATRLLPSTVPPGEYFYFASIYDYCGPNRATFLATTQHIPLTVK
jgi:hypothetical protein